MSSYIAQGKARIPDSNPQNPQHAVFLHSKDGGKTWDNGINQLMIHGLYMTGNLLPTEETRWHILTSGKIMQSHT